MIFILPVAVHYTVSEFFVKKLYLIMKNFAAKTLRFTLIRGRYWFGFYSLFYCYLSAYHCWNVGQRSPCWCGEWLCPPYNMHSLLAAPITRQIYSSSHLRSLFTISYLCLYISLASDCISEISYPSWPLLPRLYLDFYYAFVWNKSWSLCE